MNESADSYKSMAQPQTVARLGTTNSDPILTPKSGTI